MAAGGVRGVVAAAAGTLLLGGALTGCAGGPPTIAPSGVDGLTIPTPSPQASDFVRTVDNPWFPLAPGSRWVYRLDGDGGRRTLLVGAPGRTRVIDGVTCTGLHQVVREGVTREGRSARARVVEDSWSWFAQDRSGNVWQFGGPADTGRASWLAGVAGAEAGLVMAAHPRRGDGYAVADAPGVAEDRATVLSVDEERAVPSGHYSHLVETEDTTPLAAGLVNDTYYARGLGVVFRETVAGGTGSQVLVAFSRP